MEKDRDTLRGQTDESNPDADFGKQFTESENSMEDLFQKIQSLTISMEKSKGKVVDSEYAVLLQEREKLLARLNEAKKKLDLVRLKLLQLAEEDGIPSSPTASFVGLNTAALNIIASSANPGQSTSPTEDKMDQ